MMETDRMRSALRALAGLLIATAPAAALAQTPASSQAPAASQPTGPRFDIKRYAVDGATLLPAPKVQAVLAPFVGRQRDFSAVQGALRALERAYADAGYSAVQVVLPEQELRDGEIRITVTELKLGQLTVEGNRFFKEPNIRRTLPALREGSPPNVDAIARNLRTANENPAKNTTVLLRQGETPGTIDALARVNDQKAWRGAVSLDGTGTPSTGFTRLGVSMQHANLFDRDHVFSAQYITSPENVSRVTIVGLGYHLPLYSRGDSIDLSYVYADVNAGLVPTAGGDFSISGGGNFSTIRYNFNLPRRGNWDQKFIFGGDWRAYSSNVLFNGVGTSQFPNQETHLVSIGYSGRRRTESDDLSLFFSAIRNIPGGADGGSTAFGTATTNFTAYRFGASYLRILPKDWQMRLGFSGQHTSDTLIAGERFGAGGMDSVRGFYEREVAFDRGHRIGLEVITPDLAIGSDRGVSTRGVAFYDYGYLRASRPLTPSDPRGETIAGFGVGLRATYRDTMSLRVDLASVQQGGGVQRTGDTRLHGMISVFF
jgi:hemolysin activation/secretion protein